MGGLKDSHDMTNQVISNKSALNSSQMINADQLVISINRYPKM